MLALSLRYAFIAALMAFVSRGAAAGTNRYTNLLDEESVEDSVILTRLVKYVCNETASASGSWQISRVSTVVRLHDYFETLSDDLKDTPANNKLRECKQKSFKPIRDLKQVLLSGNTNVCSDEKVALIERFHADYISIHLDHTEKRRMRKDRLPSLLKLFFMHYAMEVSFTCKRNLINNIEWDVHKLLDSEDFDNLLNGNVESLVNIFSSSLITRDKVRDFDDVILIWDLIDSFKFDVSDWGEEGPPLVELADLDADGVRARLKVRQVSSGRFMQEICAKRFRPLYSKLIVPIIRLSNLGYSYQGDDLSREIGELRQNPTIRRWYAITQICEAILPMKFYEDPSIPDNKGCLITWDEVAELEVIQPPRDPKLDEIKEISYEPSINSFERLDQMVAIETPERQKLVDTIDLGASQRSRAMLRAIQRTLRDMKNIFSILKMVTLFVTEKKQDLEDKKVNGLIDATPALKEFESMSEEELLNMEGGLKSRRTIVRSRRVRKNDIETGQKRNAAAISYMHTRSLGEILRGWQETIERYLPSRRVLIVVGILVLVLGVIGIFCAALAGVAAAG